MKIQNFKLAEVGFSEFALSNEEMIYVRGGEGDPIALPTPPPIKI